MTTWPRRSGIYQLGDLATQTGEVLPGAFLSWSAHGTLSASRDNAVLYPTSFGARHDELEWLIGVDGVLDPSRWFIVQIDMFGGSLSSSPSNTPDYPALVTAYDNVRAQAVLLRDVFDITALHAVYGWSMGAQQAYHWAALLPQAVRNAVIVCGSARTSPHNQVFLRSLMAILEAAPEYRGNGRFAGRPTGAMRAFARVFASNALSQDFYRVGLHLDQSTPDLEAFLNAWEGNQQRRDPANLYAHLRCWDAADISANDTFHNDLTAALAAIRARVLLMPAETDMYFRVADNAAEAGRIARAELRPIPGVLGHRSGNPRGWPAETAFLRDAVRTWLN